MEIEPIEKFLGEMTLFPLKCLRPDRETYGLMMLQPDGPIEGSTNRVGHKDVERGKVLCRSFLEKCVQEGADLVVCPEYCMPWSIVDEVVQQGPGMQPKKGAIWVLGCESASRDVISTFVLGARARGHVVVHEEVGGEQSALGSYFDPLLYIFWVNSKSGESLLCFTIQFKTTPSRDKLDIEQRSLILGKRVYTINRGINQIGMMAFICSDAFDFGEDKVHEYQSNMLIFHIQLNPSPSHADYAAYRRRLISTASTKDTELICLNWAGGIVEVSETGNEKKWGNNSGSAIYVPPQKFNAEELIVIESHRKGLYYSLVGFWHRLFLNQEPHAILLQKQKLMTLGVPVSTTPKTCASVAKRWIWEAQNALLKEGIEPDDGFGQALTPYASIHGALLDMSHKSPISVERSLEMLVGGIKQPECWFEIESLESMKTTDQEEVRRVTVHQDNVRGSPGIDFRKRRLQRAEDAINLVGNGVSWPAPLRDLEAGFSFHWAHSRPYTNVISSSGVPAGVVYLADQSDEEVIKEIHRNALACAQFHVARGVASGKISSTDEMVRCGDRICVVYRKKHSLEVWGVDRISKIDRNPGQEDFDIAGAT